MPPWVASLMVALQRTPRTAAPWAAASRRQARVSEGVTRGRAESWTATRVAEADTFARGDSVEW